MSPSVQFVLEEGGEKNDTGIHRKFGLFRSGSQSDRLRDRHVSEQKISLCSVQSLSLIHISWGLGNRLTAACLSAIGETGGPRCCKRDSFTALHEAVKFIGKNLGIVLEEPEQLLCRFSDRNSQCIRFRCPYYPGRRNGSKNTLTGIQNTNEASK